jgi:photosynthetic reaction center cytochrome c subunit
MTRRFVPLTTAALGLGLLLGLAACEPGPKQQAQYGFRGTSMESVTTVAANEKLKAANVVPPAPYDLDPATLSESPMAKDVYQNIQVLTDLRQEEFDRLMQGITEWVVPANVPEERQGCNYCHNPENLASDEIYTKVVARKMIQMTRTINANWQPHVAKTGVTCWTCHRGNAVPAGVWSTDMNDPVLRTRDMTRAYQNNPVMSVNASTLPHDPYTPYLLNAQEIRVQSKDPLPRNHVVSIRKTEQSYALMIHMSQALGKNCTFCHNSGAFASWDKSPPQRATAWHGIRMTRAINVDYMNPLQPVFSANAMGIGGTGPMRVGAKGDVLKVNCTTCHQGVNKPMYGVSMLPAWPELARPKVDAAVLPAAPAADGAAAPSPAAEPAASDALPPVAPTAPVPSPTQ